MNRIWIVVSLIGITSCKEAPKSIDNEGEKTETLVVQKTNTYPVNLSAILEAHGGLEAWRAKRTLSFTMPKPDGGETHTTDLFTRNEKIATPNFKMGYDGKDFWLADENKVYEGDPVFYHNLMFYFYAMPFVLADDGINYGETDNLEFEGKSYPGIRISYDDGVGISSKDEYFLHYDADTNQMAWLGYTVTFRSGEKSENVKWIRYNDWQQLNGLVLPNSLTWHKVEDGKIMEAASTRNFENVFITDVAKTADFYAMPENGKIVTKQ